LPVRPRHQRRHRRGPGYEDEERHRPRDRPRQGPEECERHRYLLGVSVPEIDGCSDQTRLNSCGAMGREGAMGRGCDGSRVRWDEGATVRGSSARVQCEGPVRVRTVQFGRATVGPSHLRPGPSHLRTFAPSNGSLLYALNSVSANRASSSIHCSPSRNPAPRPSPSTWSGSYL
jgi:hypothetical protein